LAQEKKAKKLKQKQEMEDAAADGLASPGTFLKL
jgi:hypothetical protein